jgi:hypothetical protein
MKQFDLFGSDFKKEGENKYTNKIQTPIYEPKNKCPHILELFDDSKTKRLIQEIEQSDISDLEKKFLIESAKRHTIFNYSKIADYYAHASPEMQNLMERSALVIIDFDKAIQLGYVKLNDEMTQHYLSEE